MIVWSDDHRHMLDYELRSYRRRQGMPRFEEHPTVTIAVHGQEAEIDAEIVPLIRWFNDFPGVNTLYSCQGDPLQLHVEGIGEPFVAGSPYVIWTCDSSVSLRSVLESFDGFNIHPGDPERKVRRMLDYSVKTEVACFEGLIRFHSCWYDNLCVRDFMGFLGILP